MKAKVLVPLLIALCISIATNVFFFSTASQSRALGVSTGATAAYPYLSKKIFTDHDSDLINNFLPLRKQIHEMTDPYHNDIALYFEYLPTGVSIGINQDAEFTPASLLKVPVVMAYFYKKERLNLTSDPTVTVKENELDSHFGKGYTIGAGNSLNLGEAVKDTLQQSDNTSSLVISDYIDNTDYEYINEGLDIDLKADGTTPIITSQEYSSILKALYFSSILNKKDSQYILDLLTKTKFHDMLPSGIPATIPVAHKIGLVDKEIYNDCGIVYVPQRPYILCIISKSDSTNAKSRMHDISKAVYDYVAGYKVN